MIDRKFEIRKIAKSEFATHLQLRIYFFYYFKDHDRLIQKIRDKI